MPQSSRSKVVEIVFRQHPLWFLINNFILLCIGTSFLAASIRFKEPIWLIGAAFVVGVATLLTCQFNAQAITIRGTIIICRYGMLTLHENALSVLSVQMELKKPLLGRLLGYATVRMCINGHWLEFRRIARASDLQLVVADIQDMLMRQLASVRRLDNPLGY